MPPLIWLQSEHLQGISEDASSGLDLHQGERRTREFHLPRVAWRRAPLLRSDLAKFTTLLRGSPLQPIKAPPMGRNEVAPTARTLSNSARTAARSRRSSRATGYRLQATGYRLQAPGFGKKASLSALSRAHATGLTPAAADFPVGNLRARRRRAAPRSAGEPVASAACPGGVARTAATFLARPRARPTVRPGQLCEAPGSEHGAGAWPESMTEAASPTEAAAGRACRQDVGADGAGSTAMKSWTMRGT